MKIYKVREQLKIVASSLILICLGISCSQSGVTEKPVAESPVEQVVAETVSVITEQQSFDQFDRDNNIQRIEEKIESGEPLYVHLFVPLCDNEHQGIVPVSRLLGNGMDLRNNLYWGAKYGIKSFFASKRDWELLSSIKDVNENILERIILYKRFPNGAKVYLTADAYRGDRMKVCLIDVFESIAGSKKEIWQYDNDTIGISANADLIVFNGHNGLMDYNLDYYTSVDNQIRDVSAIGCVSHSYFKNHLLRAKGYPVLMTTNLMSPEAYVAEALIDAWINLKPEHEIRTSAGAAYHQYQQCGLSGATNLFKA